MSIKRLIFFLVTLLLFAGASEITSSQTLYEIEGAVYGPDSKPIATISVTLENHAHAQISQDVTNNDGRYRFSGILAGVYYISIKPDESRFQPIVQRIELINTAVGVTNFSTERIDFSLRPAARRSDSAPLGTVFAQAVPPHAEKEYLSGMKSLTKGDRDQAVSHFAKAIEAFPSYYLALQQLGMVYVETEKHQQAIEPLKQALQINPKGAEAHMGLGMVYVNLDQLKPAIEELKIARALEPRLYRAHLYLGMALIGVDELDEAEKSLKQAYAIGGPTQGRAAHLYLASIYDKRKQYQKAIDELEAYLRDNPKASNASRIQEAIKKLKTKSQVP